MTDWYGIFLRMMPTVFGSMRSLGFSHKIAILVQYPISIVSAIALAWLLWKETDPLRSVFVMACGIFLISPYGFNYDMGALTVTAAMVVGSGRLASKCANISVSIVAGISGAVMSLGLAYIPITPIILVCGLIATQLDAWKSNYPNRGLG